MNIKAKIPGLLFSFVGGVTLLFGVHSLSNAHASKSWPTVQGKVAASSVERKESSNERNRTASITYRPDVFYKFTLEGKKFSSNRVAFGDVSTSSRSRAQKTVNKYPKGSEVKVYYSPADPDVSVLEPGIQLQTLFLPCFGLVFLCVGMWLFIYTPGKGTEAEREPLEVA